MNKPKIALDKIISYIKCEATTNCGMWDDDEHGFNFGSLLDDIEEIAKDGLKPDEHRKEQAS